MPPETPEIWYEATTWRRGFNEIVVIRETDKYVVTPGGRRLSKTTAGTAIRKTKAEAKAAIMKITERLADAAERRLRYYRNDLDEWQEVEVD